MTASPAFTFVLIMGMVNFFGDVTYEGGASINDISGHSGPAPRRSVLSRAWVSFSVAACAPSPDTSQTGPAGIGSACWPGRASRPG
jgi:hypothetical protein